MVSPVSKKIITTNNEEGIQLDFREDGGTPYIVEIEISDYLTAYLNNKEIKSVGKIEQETATLHIRTEENTISNSEECTINVQNGTNCTLKVQD